MDAGRARAIEPWMTASEWSVVLLTTALLACLPLLLPGCGGPMRLELAPSEARVRWEAAVSAVVNEHETRLRALEARAREEKSDGRPDQPAR